MTNDEIKRLANRAVKLKASWKRADKLVKQSKRKTVNKQRKP